MRRLLFFVTGFVLAMALLLNMGCATTGGTFMDELVRELEEPNQNYQVPEDIQRGWSPTSESGNHWVLRDYIGGKLHVLAQCNYTYMKVRGVEMWKGKYFGMTDPMNYHRPVSSGGLENLVGCVEWVKMFYYGDYSI